MEDWQGEFFAVKDRIGKLLEKGCWSDVSFAVSYGAQEHKVFHAHRLILANASSVFAKMFFGILPKNADQVIEVKDIQPKTFSKLLKYIYADATQFRSLEDAVDLFNAAKIYMLRQLQKYCIEYFKKELTASNVLKIYEFAKFHEEQSLVEAALKVIREETIEVLDSNDFLTIDISTMITLLEQGKLQSTEFELFNALESLAKSQGAIEDDDNEEQNEDIRRFLTSFFFDVIFDESKVVLLGKFRTAVKKIQFLLMTAEQFAIGPAVSELLLPEESLAIIDCLFRPCNVINIYPKGFVHGIRPSKHLPRVFFNVTVEDNLMGRVVVELRSDVVPKSVEKFCTLFADNSLRGFKGSDIHRIDSQICQTNAHVYATGEFFDCYLDDENFILKHNGPGTFGLVHSDGENRSDCSGFYITFHKCINLNNCFVVIGQVIEGMNVIETIKSYGTESGEPNKTVIIKSCGKLQY